MPAGLQIWNASNQIILDTSTSCGRVHGVIEVPPNTAAGSRTIDSLSQGKPFIMPISSLLDGVYQGAQAKLEGNTISWIQTQHYLRIYYGTY